MAAKRLEKMNPVKEQERLQRQLMSNPELRAFFEEHERAINKTFSQMLGEQMLGEQRREEDQPQERHELAKKEEAGKTGAPSPAK